MPEKHSTGAGKPWQPRAMRTSRAIVQTGPRKLEMRELPIPDIDDDSALLRVEACGICGSDVEQYHGLLPVRFPLVPGHEWSGTVTELGDGVTDLATRDVVDSFACFTGFVTREGVASKADVVVESFPQLTQMILA